MNQAVEWVGIALIIAATIVSCDSTPPTVARLTDTKFVFSEGRTRTAVCTQWLQPAEWHCQKINLDFNKMLDDVATP